jgi:hypothetical protein
MLKISLAGLALLSLAAKVAYAAPYYDSVARDSTDIIDRRTLKDNCLNGSSLFLVSRDL